jgi:hypothetical protein
MDKPYPYKPLCRLKKEIRLLKLLPATEDRKLAKTPTCQISHVSLKDNPKFTPLSYVWGNFDDARVVHLDSLTIQVTRNLHEALMALRPTQEPIIIWVDALCINQKDVQEKSWQVNLMADIYQSAHRVVAWLGPADKNSDSTVDYLNTLGMKAEACGMDAGSGPFLEYWRELALNGEETCNPHSLGDLARALPNGQYESRCRMARDLFCAISGCHNQEQPLPVATLRKFFTRPWWGRIWVLQEVSLPRTAELLCGTATITRRRCGAAINAYSALFLALMARFEVKPLSLTSYQHEIILSLFHHRPTVMLSGWRIYRYDRFTLAALLRATCVGSVNLSRHGPHHLESTDPRDKIFALLGLAADRVELRELGVYPDYTKSWQHTYQTTMLALLAQGHLSLLSMCQTYGIRKDMPSWVPDWSQSITDMLQDVKNDHVTVYPTFNASAALSTASKVRITRRMRMTGELSMMGCAYDAIRAAGTFPNRTHSYEVPVLETSSWPVQWLLELIRLTYCSRRMYRHFGSRLHAAARTSIGGVGNNDQAQLHRIEDDRFIDAAVLLQRGIGDIMNSRMRKEARSFLAKKKIKDMITHRAKATIRLGSEIIGKSLGRLPFITEKGHLVLTSEHVQRGDVIAVIQGVQVPFILRRQQEDKYQIINEAYVDGIMDGEAVENSTLQMLSIV